LFFHQLKWLLPAHLSLVDAVAELLHLSNDSAYRRNRSETPLTVDETMLLASHFGLSPDQFAKKTVNRFCFPASRTMKLIVCLNVAWKERFSNCS
jgi:hypothetical protein